MKDLIDREAAIVAAIDAVDVWDGQCNPYRDDLITDRVKDIPAIDAIPLEWIDKHIAWLEGLDNAFSKLTASNIRVMVQHYKEEVSNDQGK